MLVLTRKLDEQILIGDDIKITVIKIRNNQVRLGITAPRDVRVLRGELEEKPTQIVVDVDIDQLESGQAEQAESAGAPAASSPSKGTNRIASLLSSSDPPAARADAGGGNASRADAAGATGRTAPRASAPTAIFTGKLNPVSGDASLKSTPLGSFFTAP